MITFPGLYSLNRLFIETFPLILFCLIPLIFCRSISAFPTVAAYNNKAQAEIKLQNWHVALHDCETVLKMDSQNVKGKHERTMSENLVLSETF